MRSNVGGLSVSVKLQTSSNTETSDCAAADLALLAAESTTIFRVSKN